MLNLYLTSLQQKKQLIEKVFLFKFKLKKPQEINFKAGQYLILKINDKSRLYSIASPEQSKNVFELLVELIDGGLASEYLKNLKRGEEVIFQGPVGMFTLRKNNKPKIFLATGTGIAPIRSIIKSIFNTQFSIFNNYLFWGIRELKELYFFNEFENLSKRNKNFQFKICFSQEKDIDNLDPTYFFKGRVNLALENFFLQNSINNNLLVNSFDYYLCGGKETVMSLINFLKEKGVKTDNILFERFN